MINNQYKKLKILFCLLSLIIFFILLLSVFAVMLLIDDTKEIVILPIFILCLYAVCIVSFLLTPSLFDCSYTQNCIILSFGSKPYKVISYDEVKTVFIAKAVDGRGIEYRKKKKIQAAICCQNSNYEFVRIVHMVPETLNKYELCHSYYNSEVLKLLLEHSEATICVTSEIWQVYSDELMSVLENFEDRVYIHVYSEAGKKDKLIPLNSLETQAEIFLKP